MTDKDNSCLADFLSTNPRSEKSRIERTKDGMLIDSFRWVLDNSDSKDGVRAPTANYFGSKAMPAKERRY